MEIKYKGCLSPRIKSKDSISFRGPFTPFSDGFGIWIETMGLSYKGRDVILNKIFPKNENKI